MNAACSTPRLEAALAGSLSAEEEAQLHQHLEECPDCAAALERLAGGADWHMEAAALLAARDPAATSEPSPKDVWSAIDFSIEHLEPSDDPQALGQLGGYDVLSVVGRGSMGVVMKAFDRGLKRIVAIKALAPHLAYSPLAKQRFAREAQAAAAVVHPHVLAIHHVQATGRLPFFVMPFIAGESLAQRLARRGSLTLVETLRIGMQTASGLAAAHEQGLVHRDVKPANVLLELDVDRALLADFGLARSDDDATLTRWGIVAGTPQYMSPEQARGEPLDGRSDLFSLGCVLYECATGVSPFRGNSLVATLRRLIDEKPTAMSSLNPESPAWFIAIVERLLDKDRNRRFASAREVSSLLEECLAHVQQPAATPLPESLRFRPVSRRLVSRRTGVVAVTSIVAVGLLSLWLTQLAQNPPTAENSAATASKPTSGLLPTPPRVRRFEVSGRPDLTEVIASTPDGKRLALIEYFNPEDAPEHLRQLRPFTPVVSIFDDAGARLNAWPFGTAEEDQMLNETGFGDRVAALAFSPDGKLLALGTSRGQVKLFDVETGKLLRSLDDVEGKKKAGGTPEAFLAFKRAIGSVIALTFSPDGRRLAIAGYSLVEMPLFENELDPLENRFKRAVNGPGRAQVWDVASGELKHNLPGHVYGSNVAFSPDGALLATTGSIKGNDEPLGNLILWNAETGQRVNELTRKADAIGSVVFAPDGKQIAFRVAFSSSHLSLAQTGSLNVLWSQPLPRGRHRSHGPQFSTDGRSLVVLNENSVLAIFNAEDGEVQRQVRVADAPGGGDWRNFTVALKADEVATVGADGLGRRIVSMWNLRDALAGASPGVGQQIPLPTPPTVVAPLSAFGAPTAVPGPGQSFITVPMQRPGAAAPAPSVFPTVFPSAFPSEEPAPLGPPRVWQPTAPVAPPQHDQQTAPAVAPQAENADPRQRVFTTEVHADLVALSSDGRRLAVAENAAGFRIRRLEAGRSVAEELSPTFKVLDAKTGEMISTGRYLTVVDAGRVLDARRQPEVVVTAIVLSSDGQRLAIGTNVGQVKLFNTNTGEVLWSLDDVEAKKKDVRTPAALHSFARALGSVAGLAFSPDGTLLATSGPSIEDSPFLREEGVQPGPRLPSVGRLKLWNVKTGELVYSFPSLSQSQGVAFSPDGQTLAAACDWDGENDRGPGVRVWDLAHRAPTRQFVTQANGGGRFVAFSPDGRQIVYTVAHLNDDGSEQSGALVLGDMTSGRVVWQRAIPNDADRHRGPKFFVGDPCVALLIDSKAIRLLDLAEGRTLAQITAPDAGSGGRWFDFATAPAAKTTAFVGQDAQGRPTVSVWELTEPPQVEPAPTAPSASPAPAFPAPTTDPTPPSRPVQ